MIQSTEIIFNGASTPVNYCEIKNRYHLMYRVWIGDYSNIIFRDVDSGKWVEEDLGFTSFAQELGNTFLQLNLQLIFLSKPLAWMKDRDKNLNFAFYADTWGKCKMYEIYGDNRKFKYVLLQKGINQWEFLNPSNSPLNNKEFAKINLMAEVLQETIPLQKTV